MMTKEMARGIAAQAWCDERNGSKQMDPDLAESFAERLMSVVNNRPEQIVVIDSPLNRIMDRINRASREEVFAAGMLFSLGILAFFARRA